MVYVSLWMVAVNAGIGTFLAGLSRMVLPWLKTGGKTLLKEGLGTDLQIAQDALSGRNFDEYMRD